jgi:hypothetical protein
LPRPNFNQINNKNIDQKERQISEKSKENQINDIDINNIVVPIKNEESDLENKELKKETQNSKISGDINDIFSDEGAESFFAGNYKQEIEKIIEENKDITLIPPKRIISILSDANGIEGNKNEKKNYEIINNILTDNIHLIKDYQNQTNNIQKGINTNNFQTNLNSNLKFGNNQIKLKKFSNFFGP